MGIPFKNAASSANALEEIGKILTRFDCGSFGTMTNNDAGELLAEPSPRANLLG